MCNTVYVRVLNTLNLGIELLFKAQAMSDQPQKIAVDVKRGQKWLTNNHLATYIKIQSNLWYTLKKTIIKA